jgi:hypothetical protein
LEDGGGRQQGSFAVLQFDDAFATGASRRSTQVQARPEADRNNRAPFVACA